MYIGQGVSMLELCGGTLYSSHYTPNAALQLEQLWLTAQDPQDFGPEKDYQEKRKLWKLTFIQDSSYSLLTFH